MNRKQFKEKIQSVWNLREAKRILRDAKLKKAEFKKGTRDYRMAVFCIKWTEVQIDTIEWNRDHNPFAEFFQLKSEDGIRNQS